MNPSQPKGKKTKSLENSRVKFNLKDRNEKVSQILSLLLDLSSNQSYVSHPELLLRGCLAKPISQHLSPEPCYMASSSSLLLNCDLQTRSVSITWELGRNAGSQALAQTYRIRNCKSTRFPDDSYHINVWGALLSFIYCINWELSWLSRSRLFLELLLCARHCQVTCMYVYPKPHKSRN